MKHFIALFLTCLLLLISMTLTGCNTGSDTMSDSPNKTINTPTISEEDANDNGTSITDQASDMYINVFSPTDELPNIVIKYKDLHPDFPYGIKMFTFATVDGDFHAILNEFLDKGGEYIPDIYCIQSSKVMRYSQGELAKHAAPYKDLGIDLDRLVKEADIPQYVIDVGTNPEGQIVALGYQGTGSAFIYRRSIAKDVWGTDEPDIIKDKIGPGWEKFFEAAADLKDKGYGIVSGDGDIWHSIDNSADMPWVVNGKLYIDPKREAFFDYAKELKDKGYSNNTKDWSEEWYADMKGSGEKQILGFFGPLWLINYVMIPSCGGNQIGEGTYGDWAVCEPPVGFFWGDSWVFVNKDSRHKEVIGDIIKWITLDSSDTGLQYIWANGTFDNKNKVKEAVASGAVMKKISNKLDFVGYQDVFDVFDKAARLANGKNLSEYDEIINDYWRKQVAEYTAGNKTKEQAIEDFRQMVNDKLDIAVE